MGMSLKDALRRRLADVEGRLEAACRRAGRKCAEVTVVAVTKTVPPEVAAQLPELGLVHLGESRPQELWKKAPLVPSSAHWHLIGHLQRNKIERTLPLVRMIHSVDSLRLLEALELEAARRQGSITVLLEVNASHEAQKHGFVPDEMANLSSHLHQLQYVRIDGLMTMAALATDPERSRPTFVELRKMRDRLRGQWPAPHGLEHLSMGMSNDFEVAVEEGATMVRLGTVLFEGIDRD